MLNSGDVRQELRLGISGSLGTVADLASLGLLRLRAGKGFAHATPQ